MKEQHNLCADSGLFVRPHHRTHPVTAGQRLRTGSIQQQRSAPERFFTRGKMHCIMKSN